MRFRNHVKSAGRTDSVTANPSWLGGEEEEEEEEEPLLSGEGGEGETIPPGEEATRTHRAHLSSANLP